MKWNSGRPSALLLSLVLALFAAACGSDAPDAMEAAAQSNASDGSTGDTPSDFCAAVEELSVSNVFVAPDESGNRADLRFPAFVNDPSQADVDALEQVIAMAPADVPNIVVHYFRAAADVAARLVAGERDAPFGPADLMVILTIDSADVSRYIESACGPDRGPVLPVNALGEFLPPDPLVDPATIELCPALTEFEALSAQADRQGGQVEGLVNATHSVANALPAEGPIAAAAAVRPLLLLANAELMQTVESSDTPTEEDETLYAAGAVLAMVTFGEPDPEAWSFFDEACPEVRNTRNWLGRMALTERSSDSPEGPRPAPVFEEVSDTMTRSDPAQGIVEDPSQLVEGETNALGDFVGETTVDGVPIAAGPASWTTQRTGRPADDPTIGYLTLVLRFAADHDLDAGDFALRSARGDTYPADTIRSVIGPDRAVLEFPTDVGVRSVDGWELEIGSADRQARLEMASG